MAIDWSIVFDSYGLKTVSKTDKRKNAYVVNKDQREALAEAGQLPTRDAAFRIDILFDAEKRFVESSYYNSLRKEPGRTPEARMGLEFVHWVEVGDLIVLGNIGTRMLAAKVSAVPTDAAELGRELARTGNRHKIFAKAKRAKGKPERKVRKVTDFVRNPNVIAAALQRAEARCEMPECTRRLFARDDGSNFLEVHHITPLAEEGEDTLANAAALCPSCHRELHHGVKRLTKREILRMSIGAKSTDT